MLQTKTETQTDKKPVLSVRGLSKSFVGKTVVDQVSFDLHPGEIIALVGENGAGKSTTKNMLCGLLQPTKGEIYIDGEQVDRVEGELQGISAVHQELSLFQTLTVAENMCISRLPGTAININWKEADQIAKDQLEFLGIDIDRRATIDSLGAGKQQIVEIGKALLHTNKVLILDEPTTSLTALEREKLFNILDKLKEQGLAMIFISHFMEEIYRVCDSFIALRDGCQVGRGKLSDVPRHKLEEMMVGRTIGETKHILSEPQPEVALKVVNFNSEDFHDINLSVQKGEILGVAGLMGAGRTELAEAIFGIRQAKGQVFVHGKEVNPVTVGNMKAVSTVYVPEDRRTNGLFFNRSVRENLSAAALLKFIKRKVKGFGFGGEKISAAKIVDEMNISVPHIENSVGDLSGGNQQKVLLGRWLAMAPELVILDEPTKGVDIGAKFEIHSTIVELARAGVGVMIVSSDLPELLSLAHRITVMRKGRIAGEFDRAEFDPTKIISLAASTGETSLSNKF